MVNKALAVAYRGEDFVISEISLWMEARGLVSDELITNAVREMTEAEQDQLRDEFNNLLKGEQKEHEQAPATPAFNFLASSSFRGEHCCAHPNCRMKKAPQLFTFGALYADRLYVPFDTGFRGDRGYRLEGSLRMAHFTRPLIDAGIVKASLGTINLCRKCREQLTGASTDLGSKAYEIQLAHVSEFTVTVRVAERRNNRILISRVTGPREYLDARAMYYEIAEVPEEALRFSDWTVLSAQEVMDLRILDRIFLPSINDFMLQRVFKRVKDAFYISDLPGETEFFEAVRGRTDAEAWQISVLQHLNHEIPVFHDLPMERLIGLRHEEEFAFRNYRNAVLKAIRVAPTGGDPVTAAKTIWEQQIRPEVELLESKAYEIRKSFRNALVTRMIPTAAILSVGLFGSSLPNSLSHAINLAAGCNLVKDLLPSRRGSTDDQLATEDFYFLLKASEQ